MVNSRLTRLDELYGHFRKRRRFIYAALISLLGILGAVLAYIIYLVSKTSTDPDFMPTVLMGMAAVLLASSLTYKIGEIESSLRRIDDDIKDIKRQLERRD